VRRDDLALVLANDEGQEFRLVVDDAVLAELRHLSRREREPGRIQPRQIQALIRAGRTRAEVAKETGLDEADIERYEEPVLAERRYIIERAHAVPVRVEAHDDEQQRFGTVIADRLSALDSEVSEWDSWKEDEAGWMVALEFISRETAHRAVWAFDHRKGQLAPVTADAVNLSKQGEVGDRLIPKLRAVDDTEARGRFDSGAFDAAELDAEELDETGPAHRTAPAPQTAAPQTPAPASTSSPRSDEDSDAEYERIREIEQRAVKTEDSDTDLSQTADLLDALRRRRGERERSSDERAPSDVPGDATPLVLPAPPAPPAENAATPSSPRSIWAAGGVSREATEERHSEAEDPSPKETEKSERPEPSRKGRASIPSWDDILFGTRSDDDPA